MGELIALLQSWGQLGLLAALLVMVQGLRADLRHLLCRARDHEQRLRVLELKGVSHVDP